MSGNIRQFSGKDRQCPAFPLQRQAIDRQCPAISGKAKLGKGKIFTGLKIHGEL